MREDPVMAAEKEQAGTPMLGTLDDPGTVDSMRHLAGSVRGARLEEFESAHMVNLEHPERFNRVLRAFLDGHDEG